MHFIVGIDLGTTHCTVAYVEKSSLAAPSEKTSHTVPSSPKSPKIQIFEIPQLVRLGVVEARPLLPSFLYLANSSELPSGATALPWDENNTLIVGELARSLGAKVPGRLVSSAKSWLCSPSVDRTAAILPWGATEDVKRVSPVDASAHYLRHIRQAWDQLKARDNPEYQLAAQDIIITVPASFDEAARELTVAAAKSAGFENLTLLEEPQAAFYAFISAQRKTLSKKLSGVERVVVCDVGGGTTDFSLIDVRRIAIPKRSTKKLEIVRSAVGDHLMLGGDNMDLTLARFLEKKFAASAQKVTLDAHQFKALTAAARDAKEKLLSEASLEKAPITIVGRGSGVVAGTLRTELTLADIQSLLLDGFFPQSTLLEDPSKAGRIGIREWGLPYAHDPAVTRHLSQFLRHHARTAGNATVTGLATEAHCRPDAVLFNGGAMKPESFRARIRTLLKSWFGNTNDILELENPSLDLAVAIGAAYYGCVRRGEGMRIGGGMARTYYIGIETGSTESNGPCKAAICLVPHGTEEGSELVLPQTFILRLATPVVFPLFSSSVRTEDKIGTLIAEDSPDIVPLPPLETILHAGRRAVKKDVSVQLQARLTEVGTLELGLKALGDERRWEIHLNIRSKLHEPNSGPTTATETASPANAPNAEPAPDDDAESGSGTGVDPRKLELALALIIRAFAPENAEPILPGALTKQLENALELSKEAWPANLARRLADTLLEQSAHRARSPEHETRWLNLAGYMLRPGFGFLADEDRMRKLYNATRNGLYFVSEPNCRIEWWVLWRRLSAGLKEDHQREIFYRLQPFLTEDRDVSKRQGWPRPSKGEVPEMWRTAASLELLDTPQKKILGNQLIGKLKDEGLSQALLWAIGRVGARVPAHAPENRTVPLELAEFWLQEILTLKWAAHPDLGIQKMGVFAVVNLSRKTGDRSRDISESLRQKTLDNLKQANASEHDLTALKSVTELENSDQKLIFGDALPPALRMAAVL